MSVEYEVIGSFAPDDEKNGIEQAVVKLKTVLDGAKILEDESLTSTSRYLVAMGIYNGFYSCFETVRQKNKKTPERKAFAKWTKENQGRYEDIGARYRVFRNLMTNQGHYIAGSALVWEDDIANDTVRPIRAFPAFLNEKSGGAVIKTYTLWEWVEECYQLIYTIFNEMEGIRRDIVSNNVSS